MKELKLKFCLFMTAIAIKLKKMDLAVKWYEKSSEAYFKLYNRDWREEL